jgi:molybdopterin-guanine dinucleotide biosynthesis protein
MAPFVIGVGGAYSGSGKTSVLCRLLGSLRGWGAVKCTPSELYSSVIDDPVVLSRNHKDTGRYIEAGAGGVLWVQATQEDLEETLAMALGRFSGLRGVMVEGNSAIEVLKPDIVIFILGEPGKFKDSARGVLAMANLVIVPEDGPPAETPEGVEVFRSGDWGDILQHILDEMDERGNKGTTPGESRGR